jgi:hypothetical protein
VLFFWGGSLSKELYFAEVTSDIVPLKFVSVESFVSPFADKDIGSFLEAWLLLRTLVWLS